jgi:hypothetical protein
MTDKSSTTVFETVFETAPPNGVAHTLRFDPGRELEISSGIAVFLRRRRHCPAFMRMVVLMVVRLPHSGAWR